MQKITALILLTLCSAGCVTGGTKVNPNMIASFQPGVTTLDQAEARLGRPFSISRTSDASTIISYRDARAQADVLSYVPIVDAFVGDTDPNINIVVLNFDKESKFAGSTLTQSTSAQLFSQK